MQGNSCPIRVYRSEHNIFLLICLLCVCEWYDRWGAYKQPVAVDIRRCRVARKDYFVRSWDCPFIFSSLIFQSQPRILSVFFSPYRPSVWCSSWICNEEDDTAAAAARCCSYRFTARHNFRSRASLWMRSSTICSCLCLFINKIVAASPSTILSLLSVVVVVVVMQGQWLQGLLFGRKKVVVELRRRGW